MRRVLLGNHHMVIRRTTRLMGIVVLCSSYIFSYLYYIHDLLGKGVDLFGFGINFIVNITCDYKVSFA